MDRFSKSLKKVMSIEEMNVYHLINALKIELEKVTVGEAVENSEIIAEMFDVINKKIKEKRATIK
jgi:hypothetical protein